MSADDPRLWLDYARWDLRAARRLAAPEDPIVENAAYAVQQTAEKLVKALLVGRAVRVLKVHDIQALLNLLPLSDPLRLRLAPLARFSRFATHLRYPGSASPGPTPSAADVSGWVDEIERLMPEVEATLPARTGGAA